MKYLIYRNYFYLVFLTPLLFIGPSETAIAGAMAPMMPVSVAEYLKSMKGYQKNNALTNDQIDVLYFVRFAKSTVGVDKVLVIGSFLDSQNQLAQQVRLGHVVDAFEDKLASHDGWNLELDKKYIQKISKDKVRLEKLLHANKYSWAWVLKQTGEIQQSQILLSAVFETEYQRVMDLKWVSFDFGSTPLGRSEYILKTLNSRSDLKTQAVRNEKMRKMKVHVGKLSQSNINT